MHPADTGGHHGVPGAHLALELGLRQLLLAGPQRGGRALQHEQHVGLGQEPAQGADQLPAYRAALARLAETDMITSRESA